MNISIIILHVAITYCCDYECKKGAHSFGKYMTKNTYPFDVYLSNHLCDFIHHSFLTGINCTSLALFSLPKEAISFCQIRFGTICLLFPCDNMFKDSLYNNRLTSYRSNFTAYFGHSLK